MLKYECDICHKIVEPADTYGRDVLGAGVYQWRDPATLSGLMVSPFVRESADGHVCGSCTGDLLIKMVAEIWPEKNAAGWSDPLCVCGHPRSSHEGLAGYPIACTHKNPDGALVDNCMEFEESHGEEYLGDNRADSNMREVRAKQALSESDTDCHPKITFPCLSCNAPRDGYPEPTCEHPSFHKLSRNEA